MVLVVFYVLRFANTACRRSEEQASTSSIIVCLLWLGRRADAACSHSVDATHQHTEGCRGQSAEEATHLPLTRVVQVRQ